MMRIFRNIGDKSALAVDALQGRRISVPPNGLILVTEKEGSRLEALPHTFGFERAVSVNQLLRNALEETKRPFSALQKRSHITKGKILFLFSSEGGLYLGQRIWELQIGIKLAQAGYNVHFLADEVPPYAKEWPGVDKVTWERSGETGYHGFDFVVGTPPQNLERALAYGKKYNLPVIFVCGELVSDTPGRRASTEEIMRLDKLYQEAQAVIAPSDSMRKRMVASGVEADKISVVPPAINPQLLTIPVPPREGEKKKVILCARLDVHKQLIPAVRILLAHPVPFDITVITSDSEKLITEVGRGSERHKLDAFNSVSEFEKGKLFSQADVLIHPSNHEGYGMTVMEALTLGMNVVAKDLSVYHEVYGDDIFYFFNDSDFNEAIASALEAPRAAFREKYRAKATADHAVSLGRVFRRQEVAAPTNAKRVIVVGNTFKWGGGDASRNEIVSALESAGLEVDFVSWGETESGLIQEAPKNFHRFKIHTEVADFVIKERPGLVIVDQKIASSICPRFKENGIPFAIFFQFYTPFMRFTTHVLERKKEEMVREDIAGVLSNAEFVIANSEYMADALKKYFGLESIICHPGIDRKRLFGKPGPKKRDQIVTTILEPEEMGLKLYEEILQRLPNRSFLALSFRGNWEKAEELMKKHPNLTILKGTYDIAPHLYSARVFLYTIQVDHSFGKSFFEALLTKTPIIASKLGNPSRVIDDGAIWLESFDSKIWAEEIEKCFKDEDHYKNLVDGAKRSARKIPEHDPSGIVEAARKLLFRPHKVVLTNRGGFLAGSRCFREMAKQVEGASFESGDSNRLVFFGPPSFQKDLVSPQSFAYWASTVLQTALDQEIEWLRDAITYVNEGKLGGMIFADQGTLELAKVLGCTRAYHVRPPAPTFDRIPKVETEPNSISLIFSRSPRKNLLNQLLAIRKLDDDVTVHVPEALMEFIPPSFKTQINFVRHDHIPDEEYFDLIGSCAAGLQVSIGESFAFAPFEHISFGVPCLVGISTKFAPDLPKKFADALVVKNVDDVDEIAEKLQAALTLPKTFRKELSKWAKKWGESWNKELKKEFEIAFS